MSTKSQLQTAIQNALTPPIQKTEHVAAEVLVLDNLYPTPILCNNLPTGGTNGVLTPNGAINTQFRYILRFRKIGNCVFVEGTGQNLTNLFSQLSLNIATISDPEFVQDVANGGSTPIPVISTSGTQGVLNITGNSINFSSGSSGIPPNQTVIFKGYYFTQP